MADIALSVDDKQQIQIKAQRWQWNDKGWQLVEQPREILQLIEQNPQLLNLQKSEAINTSKDFIVLDRWPSVERTPKDNVWRYPAKP